MPIFFDDFKCPSSNEVALAPRLSTGFTVSVTPCYPSGQELFCGPGYKRCLPRDFDHGQQGG